MPHRCKSKIYFIQIKHKNGREKFSLPFKYLQIHNIFDIFSKSFDAY